MLSLKKHQQGVINIRNLQTKNPGESFKNLWVFIGQRVTPAPTCFFQTQAIRVPGFRPVVFPFCWFDKNFKSPGDFEKHLIHPPGGAFCEMLEGPNFQLELTKKKAEFLPWISWVKLQ